MIDSDARLATALEIGKRLFGDAPPPPGMPQEFLEVALGHLYGEVWTRETLSVKLRSLITVISVLSLARPHEARMHLAGALNVGWTPAELREAITHVAYYAGFPTAVEGHRILSELLDTRVSVDPKQP